MMPLSAFVQAHASGPVLRLAWLLELLPDPETVGPAAGAPPALRFSSHDQDLWVEGALFPARHRFEPASLERRLDLAVETSELNGLIEAPALAEADLMAGRWDGARMRLMLADWGVEPVPAALLAVGHLGEVTRQGGAFRAEFRGLQQALQQEQAVLYTEACRHRLGDAGCGVELGGWRRSVRLVAQAGLEAVVEPLEPGAGWEGWLADAARWVGGRLGDPGVEILQVAEGPGPRQRRLRLMLAGRVGDAGAAVAVTAGCDGAFATCGGVFGNVARFGGFPWLPGDRELLKGAG